MKCLFAMKFYSLIWHINEEAFGVRQRPGGSYRWPRCCSTPDDKHCNVLLAAPLCCWDAGPALVFQRNTHLFTEKRKKAPIFPAVSAIRFQPVTPTKHHQSSHQTTLALTKCCQLPWAHPHPEHRSMSRVGVGGGGTGKGDAGTRTQMRPGTILAPS